MLLARFLEIPLDTLFNDKIALKIEDNGYQGDNIEAYQELLEEKLSELIQQDLPIRDISIILNSTPKTVRRNIDKLGIELFWKDNGGGKYRELNYADTEEFKVKLQSSRKEWLELLEQYPDKSSNQINQYNQALHRWLTKYDLE